MDAGSLDPSINTPASKKGMIEARGLGHALLFYCSRSGNRLQSSAGDRGIPLWWISAGS
jgi:hypothetical protein